MPGRISLSRPTRLGRPMYGLPGSCSRPAGSCRHVSALGGLRVEDVGPRVKPIPKAATAVAGSLWEPLGSSWEPGAFANAFFEGRKTHVAVFFPLRQTPKTKADSVVLGWESLGASGSLWGAPGSLCKCFLLEPKNARGCFSPVAHGTHAQCTCTRIPWDTQPGHARTAH